MSSTATTRYRLQKQGTGDSNNTWGSVLNSTVFDLVDAAIGGMASYTLSGTKTLTSTNYAADEARMPFQNVTGGSGGTVTIPSLEGRYFWRNASSGDVIVTTGSGATATIKSGDVAPTVCDGTNVYLIQPSNFGAVIPQTSGTATSSNDITNKSYVDAAVVAAASGGVTLGYTQIGSTVTTTSGTTATFSSIPATYGDLLVEILGCGHNSGSSQSLMIELSPDGAAWTGSTSVSGLAAGTDTLYGSLPILGYRKGAGTIQSGLVTLTSNNTVGTGADVARAWRISAGIQAIRFSWTGSASFDSGAIKLHGR